MHVVRMRLKPDPHLCYVASFTIAMAVYLLGWSDLYPSLTIPLLGFLVATFIIHFWLSRRFQKRPAETSYPDPAKRSPVYITAFIYVLWLAEFMYEGGVPLFKILLDIPYNYRLFGIPSLHVFVVTFSSFYTVYLFQLYLSRKSKLILLLYALNLVAAVLIYSRAMLFFNLTSSLFLYLNYKGGFSIRQVLSAGATVIVLLFFFGVLGSLRVSRLAGEPYGNENFLATGRATDAFKKSFIPAEYFWSYIYISSPLANLQQNINLQTPDPPTIGNIAKLINSEILPDFASKRIQKLLNLTVQTDSRIPGPFNVSTVYSRAYSYAGWTGLVLTAAFLLTFPIVFTRILPLSSRFFLPAGSILCTMYFFSVYDNTFRFTGLSLQLAYPLLLYWVDRKYSRLPRVF